ncbi:hypothetical protein CHUAL_012021 [Chamberlinius hualienensis]
MPLPKRVTEPVHVSRGILPEDISNGSHTGTLSRRSVPNELECVTNGTLANIIRQLSTLSKHAENLFGELADEAYSVLHRTKALQGRVDRLSVKVTQLDSNVEEVSLQDIHMRKAFKSQTVFDQQVVSRLSIPISILETYQQCDRPPPLDKLNCYREDGKDGLKFYTDPNYFFELWSQEMLKDTERMERMIQDKGRKQHRPTKDGKRNNRKVRQPHNSRDVYVQNAAMRDIIQTGSGDGGPMLPDHIPNHYPPQQTMRPNSLILQMSYAQQDVYGTIVEGGTHVICEQPPLQHIHQQHSGPAPPAYMDHPEYTQYQPPPPYSPTPYSTAQQTPTRQLSRNMSNPRPAHPPPAPPGPVNTGSGSSTPVIPSSESSTPVSARNKNCQARESLPPPPPPPDELANSSIPSHLQKTRSLVSRSSTPVSPGSLNSTPTHNNVQLQLQQGQHANVNDKGTPDSMDLPPPPPTPDKEFIKTSSEEQMMPSPPPLSTGSASPPVGIPAPPPPPPPPPPPAMSNGFVAIVNGDASGINSSESVNQDSDGGTVGSPNSSQVKAGGDKPCGNRTSRTNTLLPAAHGARSDLLAAIREGIKLRKVEDIKQKEVEKHAAPHDVASILARRVAMEFSDSDTASESEYDSEAWDEDGSG